jgi:hypothetical protein
VQLNTINATRLKSFFYFFFFFFFIKLFLNKHRALWDLSNKNHSQFNLIKIGTLLYKYVCTNIDTRYYCGGIAEYIAECNSRCVADYTLTDWLIERLTSRYKYIRVDYLEHSRNEIIIAYSRTWDFPLSTDNIVNNPDDSWRVVYVTTAPLKYNKRLK